MWDHVGGTDRRQAWGLQERVGVGGVRRRPLRWGVCEAGAVRAVLTEGQAFPATAAHPHSSSQKGVLRLQIIEKLPEPRTGAHRRPCRLRRSRKNRAATSLPE